MPVVHFLCCVSQLVLPSCLQGFYDVLRRNSQLASSIMETLLSQVKSCSVVGLQNSALPPAWQTIKYWGSCFPSHWKHVWVLWHFPKEVFKPLLYWESRLGKHLETNSFRAVGWKRKDLLELFPTLQFLGTVENVSPEKFFVLSLFLSSAQQLPSHSSPRICADTVIIVAVFPSGEYPSPCRIWED